MTTTKTTKTVLITGASGGIGRATALRLAERGHRVFAAARRRDKLEALAREAPGIEPLSLDVTDEASIAAARELVLAKTGGYGVDAIVNNAGYAQVGPLELVDTDALRRQFETNVFGLMAVTRAFLPEMRERGDGRIVNVSSLAGRISFPMMGAYTASKHAVEALSDALRLELRPFGVRVALVEPGVVKTEFAGTAVDTVREYRKDPVYGPVLDRVDMLNQRLEATGIGTAPVARAIQRAIERRRPRARYVVPFFAGAAVGALRALPTPVTDLMMRGFAGLTRRRMAPGADAPQLSRANG